MPATFPSHQGAVLPLKLWRPQWFDGVALVIGAGAPDVAYTLDGSGLPVWPLSHQQPGLILWCLPVTLLLAWSVRRAAAVVAAHLPRTLRDYGVLGVTRHRWRVTWSSALVGAESHLLLDRMGQSRPVEWTLDAIGAAVTAIIVIHIGRTRLLRAWHGPGADGEAAAKSVLGHRGGRRGRAGRPAVPAGRVARPHHGYARARRGRPVLARRRGRCRSR